MYDPAVDAARRVAHFGHDPDVDIYAAREALRPIRELVELIETQGQHPGLFPALKGDGWNGAKFLIDQIKPLIYSTEELGDG